MRNGGVGGETEECAFDRLFFVEEKRRELARGILSPSRLSGKGSRGRREYLDSLPYAAALSLHRLHQDPRRMGGHTLPSPRDRRSDHHADRAVGRLQLPAAIAPAFGVQRQTVHASQDAAGAQCEAVHRCRVCQPRDLGAVQADKIRVQQQERVVWVGDDDGGRDPALGRRRSWSDGRDDHRSAYTDPSFRRT